MSSGFRRVPTHVKEDKKQLESSDCGFILLFLRKPFIPALLVCCFSAENVFLVRRKIKIALFPLTCRKGVESVGRKIFLFFVYFFLS